MFIRKMLPYLAAVLVTTGCLTGGGGTASPLRTNDMMSASSPLPPAMVVAKNPGENLPLPYGFNGAPPQISHKVADFAIEPESNDCLMCHDPNNGYENTPYTPPTHMANGQVSNERYQCHLCHVPQTNAPALRANGNDRFIVKRDAKPK